MRVLIFHGYLLRGTGSNVYNASLAQALKKLGHEVHLLCQDRRAGELDWVDDGPAEDGGSVTVHAPDIGGLLPVFVKDRYDGFEVKTFPELSDDELDRYLEANVAAVREVVARVGPPDAALANHLIMGPVILARAGLEFALKVHGSDLSYTIRPHPDRFVPYAREGAEATNGILVGSGHTAADLFATAGNGALREKTRLGPPGVDTERFRPRDPEAALRDLGELAAGIAAEVPDDSFGRDGPAAAAALGRWSEGSPRVVFVGKLLVNKGVDLLLAAWPLVHAANPGARLLLAGFGDYRAGVEALIAALDRGDVYAAGKLAERKILRAFLAGAGEDYAEAALAAAGTVAVSGRLEHDEVAEVLPAADVLVMPSTFPEAFGMVAAEAAACGVPPVSADHSGMREVSQQLAEVVGPGLASLLSFSAEPGAVEAIAQRVNGWLALSEEQRRTVGSKLAARVHELWSWENVARGVIAASCGDLDELPRVAKVAGNDGE